MATSDADAKRIAEAVAQSGNLFASHLGLQGGVLRGAMADVNLGLGPVATEEVAVPDKMVGLIIGRGGEQISRLEAQSGAKIQMATDSGGLPERLCTISGSADAIRRARELIMNIIETRGGPRDMGPPTMGDPMLKEKQIELMVPGSKVGLIIGKGGEKIKQLQERTGTRMMIVQDGPQVENEKPLRISGDPLKVENAKQLIFEIISENEGLSDMGGFARGPKFGTYGDSGAQQAYEIPVPHSAVGVVIGKNGETIKKIENETGARIQFQPARDDVPEERICALSGTVHQVENAKRRIEDLIESVLVRDSQMGRGRGRVGLSERSPGGGPGGSPGAWGEYGAPGRGLGIGGLRNGQDKTEFQLYVPAAKTGIIIGKGGETIKQINQQSGAFCELDRRPPPNPNEKIFIIRGAPEQIELAKRMIHEKLGMGPMGMSSQFPSGQGSQSAAFGAPNWQWLGQSADPGKGDLSAYTYYQQYLQQSSAAAPSQSTPGSIEGVHVNPQTGQPDYTAQWIQYYRSIGAHKEAEALEQQLKATKSAAVPTQSSGPSAAAAAGTAAAAAAAGGAPAQDYSAQWIAYYRSIGKFQEAEAIEAQTRLKQQAGAGFYGLSAGSGQGQLHGNYGYTGN